MPLGFTPRDPRQVLDLTEEQTEVARRLGLAHRAVLDGVTGSGKTHLAAAVAAAYSQLGQRVLVVSPRKPLATWLQRALQPLGVSVMTIGECATSAFQRAGKPALQRRGFEDPEYFQAAAALVSHGRWDLVVGEEWQTASPDEQRFIQSVVGPARFIEVRDSSRELGGGRIASPEPEDRLELRTAMRGAEALTRLDEAYVHDGLEPLPPPGSNAHVHVRRVEHGHSEPQKAIRDVLAALRSRGIALGEVGVASALGRAQSGLLDALCASHLPGRALRLTEPWSLNQLACDSFAYWMGLERRVMVIVEAPGGLVDRRRRLHIALSRACEEVHFLMPRANIDSDDVLSAWLRVAGGG